MFCRQCCFVRNVTYNTLAWRPICLTEAVILLAWENSRHLATLPLVFTPNDVWETSAEVPYWWRVITQIWVVLLIGWIKFVTRHDQSPRSTILDRSPWDSTAILYFSVISRFPLKTVLFEIFLQFSLPPPYTKLKLEKKFWIHASNTVCGVREGVGPVWIGKRLETHKCPKTFVHDCR